MESTMENYRRECLYKFASVGIKGNILEKIAKAYRKFNYNMEIEYRYLLTNVTRIDYEAVRKVNTLTQVLTKVEQGNDNIVLEFQIGMPILKTIIYDFMKSEKGIDTILDDKKLKLNNVDYDSIDLKELNRIGILVS